MDKYCMIQYLYEVLRIVKFVETESINMAVRCWGLGEWRV